MSCLWRRLFTPACFPVASVKINSRAGFEEARRHLIFEAMILHTTTSLAMQDQASGQDLSTRPPGKATTEPLQGKQSSCSVSRSDYLQHRLLQLLKINSELQSRNPLFMPCIKDECLDHSIFAVKDKIPSRARVKEGRHHIMSENANLAAQPAQLQ